MSAVVYIRLYLTRILILIGMLSVLISWYFVSPEADVIANELQIWNMNIATFTLFVGLLSVYSRYIRSIMNREKYWQYHLYAAILIVVWIIFGLKVGLYSDIYQKAYLCTKITLHIAILGQLVFFMISACYRLFRMRTLRTAIFACCTLLIAICNAPIVSATFPAADKIVFWFLNYPASAGSRALLITGGVGGVVLGIRILLGLEKGALRATEV